MIKAKKIAIFVDVQNIYYTTRQAYGRQFNYRKLWQRISSEGEIISATAYSAKGDWDVGITIDVMETAKDVDTVVLLSGDGDFNLLLEKIKKDYAVSAEVYGVPALTANSLIESASIYHRIEEDLLL